MYQVGDSVIYENSGVCRVESIGPIESPVFNRNKIYYTLCPVNSRESRIFTAVDNDKINIRSVISHEEAMKLIDEIGDMDFLWITDERKREAEYKDAIHKCDCRELVKIIKTIYSRKQERIAGGKKVTAVDDKYFSIAEDHLYNELGASLGMDSKQVKQFVIDRVKQGEEDSE